MLRISSASLSCFFSSLLSLEGRGPEPEFMPDSVGFPRLTGDTNFYMSEGDSLTRKEADLSMVKLGCLILRELLAKEGLATLSREKSSLENTLSCSFSTKLSACTVWYLSLCKTYWILLLLLRFWVPLANDEERESDLLSWLLTDDFWLEKTSLFLWKTFCLASSSLWASNLLFSKVSKFWTWLDEFIEKLCVKLCLY